MVVNRRNFLLATAGAMAGNLAAPAIVRAQGRSRLKLGLIMDMSGPYSDRVKPSIACAGQAFQDFDVAAHGWDVELVTADHQNKADVASSIARQWFDRDGVDALLDVNTSPTALAVATVARDHDKAMLVSGAGTPDLTGSQCSPVIVHWAWNTYMLAKSTATAVTRRGGKTWFFVAPDYTFGKQMARDCTTFVQANGGQVLGTAFYPFPSTTDFSSYLLAAQASGAKVLALCGAGSDFVNCVKQAREFGLLNSMTMTAPLGNDLDVRSAGLEVAQGIVMTESYYWNLNDRTRAFNARVSKRVPDNWPNYSAAGIYGSAMQYFKAVADLGLDHARASGAATVARMKALPTDDDAFGVGSIRADGQKLSPVYLLQAKSPAESTGPFDVLKELSKTPADQAWMPMSEGGCKLPGVD